MLRIKIFAILLYNLIFFISNAQTCKVADVDMMCLNGLWETVSSDTSIREIILYNNNNKSVIFTYTQEIDSNYIYISQGFLGYLDYDLKFKDSIDIRNLKFSGSSFVMGNMPSKGFLTNEYSCRVMDIYCDQESFEQGASVCVKRSFISKEIYSLILQKGLADKHDYINEWALYKYIPFRKIIVDNTEILNEEFKTTRFFLKKNSQIEIIKEEFFYYKIIYNGNKKNVGWVKKTDVTY